MKRIYLFLLVFYTFSDILSAQDTIVKTDGKFIIGKITEQDETNVYIKMRKGDNVISTFIPTKDVQIN